MPSLIILDEKRLRKIKNHEAIVLVSKTLADKYDLENVRNVIEENYDFGGQSDIVADVVTTESHYFFSWLNENIHTKELNYG